MLVLFLLHRVQELLLAFGRVFRLDAVEILLEAWVGDRVEVVENQVALLKLTDAQVGLLRKLGMMLVPALQGLHLVPVDKWDFLADVLLVNGGKELVACNPALVHDFLVRGDLLLRRFNLDRLRIFLCHLVDKLVANAGLKRPRRIKLDATDRRSVRRCGQGLAV